MIVRELNLNHQEDVARWDSYARKQRALYYVSAWTRVLLPVYGFHPLYLYVEENGEMRSLFPLFAVRKPCLKEELVSIPHVEAAGIIHPSHYRRYLEYLKEHRPSAVIRLYQFRKPLDGLPANTREAVMTKDLPPRLEALLPSIASANTRRQMRHVLAQDYQVEIGNEPRLFAEFYSIYLEKMREFGTPPQSAGFMQAVLRTFGPMCQIIVVRKNHDALAAAMLLCDPGSVLHFLYIAVPRRFLSKQIGNLIHYHVMAYGIEKGTARYIMGRCEAEGSTYRYKIRLGSRAEPLYLYKFVLTSEGYRAVAEKTAKEKYRPFSRLWSRLPAVVTDRLGPQVRKWVY